jgi:hypothetical protein
LDVHGKSATAAHARYAHAIVSESMHQTTAVGTKIHRPGDRTVA